MGKIKHPIKRKATVPHCVAISKALKKAKEMAIPENVLFRCDRGGRRSGIDTRQFSYSLHIPERRAVGDRRDAEDRRKTMEPDIPAERRNGAESNATL